MKAMLLPRYGRPENFVLGDAPKPVPAPGEILIRVRAIGVFAGDCEIRGFKFAPEFWLPIRLVFGILKPRNPVLGQELAGIVEAVGADVTNFQPGDEVIAATKMGQGAYAEYYCISAKHTVALKPANLDFEAAAAIPIGGLNALHFIRKANLKPGSAILINGAGGGIGSFAVQLAKDLGAEVTATDCAAKLDMLRGLGADHVLDHAQTDFTRTGDRYDVILDIVGKSPFGRSLAVLKPGGRYLLANPRLLPMLRSLFISKRTGKRVLFKLATETAEELDALLALAEAGHIRPVIDRIYTLEDMVEAHRYIETGAKAGNVVVTVKVD